MSTTWRRFAPLGLYLALLAALAAAGLYIVQRAWNLPLQISLGLVVIGLALYAALNPSGVREALTGRQARYGSNALVMSIAFIGILVVVNFLADKTAKRWDLTEDKTYTLSSESIDTLKQLPGKVQADAYYTPQLSTESAKGLLDQFAFQSGGKFSYRFIDPNKDPVAANQAGITRDGTVVLTMGAQTLGAQNPGAQKQVVTTVTEQEITGALVRMINPTTKTVYFLTGHGEYDPTQSGDQSYSQAKTALESKNYTVKTVNLLTANKLPEDASLIVIAGPKKPVSAGEVDMLSKYVEGGGALIVMEEPLPVTQFGDAGDPLADYLTTTWGVTLGKDIVVDQTSQYPDWPYAASYGSHPIVDKLNRIVTLYPTARSVTASSAVTGVTEVELMKTAPQSWAETDLAGLTAQNPQVKFDQGQDSQGPVSLGVAAQNLQSNGRVVVFGDSDFASDAYITAYGNRDLLVNAVDWATSQENQISLTPKNNTQRFMAPPSRITMNLILLGSVFILPGLMLVSGISVWMQRRRRG